MLSNFSRYLFALACFCQTILLVGMKYCSIVEPYCTKTYQDDVKTWWRHVKIRYDTWLLRDPPQVETYRRLAKLAAKEDQEGAQYIMLSLCPKGRLCCRMLSEENYYWLIAFIVIPCESWIIMHFWQFLSLKDTSVWLKVSHFEVAMFFVLTQAVATWDLRASGSLVPSLKVLDCREVCPMQTVIITAVSTPRKILERFHLSTKLLQLVIFCSSQWPLTVEGKKAAVIYLPSACKNASGAEVFGVWPSEVRFADCFVQATHRKLSASWSRSWRHWRLKWHWSDLAVWWNLMKSKDSNACTRNGLRYGQGRGLPLQTVAQYARQSWSKLPTVRHSTWRYHMTSWYNGYIQARWRWVNVDDIGWLWPQATLFGPPLPPEDQTHSWPEPWILGQL